MQYDGTYIYTDADGVQVIVKAKRGDVQSCTRNQVASACPTPAELSVALHLAGSYTRILRGDLRPSAQPPRKADGRIFCLSGNELACAYPLVPTAELVVGNERYALNLSGGVVSRTTSEGVMVISAASGKRTPLHDLISKYRPTSGWRHTCKEVGSWTSHDLACDALLRHVAGLTAGRAQAEAVAA